MRRRKKASVGGSLDSLLDTMTNVVGILVILLVVTQLGVGNAVKRIKGFVTEVSAKEFTATKKQADEIQQLLQKQGRRWKDVEVQVPDTQLELQQQKKLLEELRRNLKMITDSQVDPAKVQRDVEARKKRVKDLEQQINRGEARVAKLKAQLDATPLARPGPAAKVINLPNPRAAPKGCTPVTFICQHGRILPVNLKVLQERAQIAINKVYRALVRPDGIDCKLLVELFEQKEIGNAYFRIKIKLIGGRPYMMLYHREKGGENVSKIRSKSSLFQKAVQSLDKKKHYVRFMVWNDSFDVYLAARKIVQGAGLLAGWIPYDPNYVWRVDLGVKVTCSTGKPPAKPKPPTTKPPATKPPAKKPPPPKKPTPKPRPRRPLPPDEID